MPHSGADKGKIVHFVIQAPMLAHVSLLGYLLRKARWAIKMAAMFQYGGHPQHKNPLIGLAVLIRDMRGA